MGIKSCARFFATSMLRRAGFTQVANMTGGFDAWLDAGFAVSSNVPIST